MDLPQEALIALNQHWTRRHFGQTGVWESDRLLHYSKVVHPVCLAQSLHTDHSK
jgi:hypothetical protein